METRLNAKDGPLFFKFLRENYSWKMVDLKLHGFVYCAPSFTKQTARQNVNFFAPIQFVDIVNSACNDTFSSKVQEFHRWRDGVGTRVDSTRSEEREKREAVKAVQTEQQEVELDQRQSATAKPLEKKTSTSIPQRPACTACSSAAVPLSTEIRTCARRLSDLLRVEITKRRDHVHALQRDHDLLLQASESHIMAVHRVIDKCRKRCGDAQIASIGAATNYLKELVAAETEGAQLIEEDQLLALALVEQLQQLTRPLDLA